MSSTIQDTKQFQWKIYRIGGLNQVMLNTSAELQRIQELDPKLWIALSCPIKKLQCNKRMLELLDHDADGRIRIQDIISAVNWTTKRLRESEVLTLRNERLELSNIRDDTPEGQNILTAAHRVLKEYGVDADSILPTQASAAVAAAAQLPFNGDGVLPPRSEFGEDVQEFIRDILNTVGGAMDANGEQGATAECAKQFLDESAIFLGWNHDVRQASLSLPFAGNSAQAYDAYRAVAEKIDDYFIRCQLAEYNPAYSGIMNAPEAFDAYTAETDVAVYKNTLSRLPLAKSDPGKPLPLTNGLNPTWSRAILLLYETVILPVFGKRDCLTLEEWTALKDLFAPYAAVYARQPETPVKTLGAERLRALIESDVPAHFAQLAQQDMAAKEDIAALYDLERLSVYHAHLYHFLMNFVSFGDFYTRSAPTIFQIGTLYIDSRSCTLCMQADDIEAHAKQAKVSGLCLAYCTCVRKNSSEQMNIVAAVTAGNADLLVPGRHGVFVDINGQEWDATLIKLVDNPISIREAVLSPYRRIGRTIATQIQKLSAAKDTQLLANTSKSLETIGAEKAKTAPSPFDIGKSVGIFAAIGLALGALGTAVASIFSTLVSLPWWQLPLIVAGIFILISGPSVILAWLKLRRRTLGPVLDASGWAVNSQLPINLAMGRFLTGTASLPPNAIRIFFEPLHKPSPRKRIFRTILIICIIAACAIGGWMGYQSLQADQTSSSAETAFKATHDPMKQSVKNDKK